jgi:hypothetical protein
MVNAGDAGEPLVEYQVDLPAARIFNEIAATLTTRAAS